MNPKQLLTILTFLLLAAQVSGQVNMATCRTFSPDKSSCMQCKGNYHPYSGVCYIDILGCEEYVSGNICRKCANGYILVNNECCDRTCLNKVYLKLQNSIEHQENKEQGKRKAEIEGYEKAVSILAKNSIKVGQNYQIVSSKSQYFNNIYRYQVAIDIQGKQYLGLLDYNIQTKQPTLVDLSLASQPPQAEVALNQQNIHTNDIYEKGYKYIYIKYGLQLYELTFSRMTALAYDRTTELKFVFVGGNKAVLIAIVVGGEGEETYTLWKEQKENGEEVRQHVETLKYIENVSKEHNFQTIFTEVVTSKAFKKNDVEVVNITVISKEQYVFVIYVRSIRIRYVIRGAYNPKTKTVTINKIDEVFHPKLQQMKEPEKPQTKVLDKKSVSSNSEAKEAFDYLYKVRPTFRQTQVEVVKIETGSEVKTMTIMQNRDGKEYRTVVLKDQKTGEMQLVDEGVVVQEAPKTTILQQNNDGTTSVITNRVDHSSKQVKNIISTLQKNHIDTSTNKIISLQTVEGPRAIEYTVVLSDVGGNPGKQVKIMQNKETEGAIVTDIINIENKARYISPVSEPTILIPASQFYRSEIKDLVRLIEHNSETAVSVSKIKKIEVVNTTLVNKYLLTVEDSKGAEVVISAIQDRADQSVKVISVTPNVPQVVEKKETTNTKIVSIFGVSTKFTNDKSILSTDQNINIAVTAINTQKPDYQNYQVVSSLTKTFTQNQLQTIILTNGQQNIQVTGSIDIKTLRYVPIEFKPLPLNVLYPVLQQKTIPTLVYPTYVSDNRQVKDSESILVQKYKIFEGKLPTSATIEEYADLLKTTFNYQIGSKRFMAVVDYNITSKSGKIIEMNPVEENVVAVSVETKEVAGQTITTSNSIPQIKKINENTDTVLTTVTTQYPLLKKYNVTSLTVTQSTLTDSFEITYTDQKDNIATVITVNCDKEGKKVTVDNIQTKEPSVQLLKSYKSEVVQIAKEEYDSSSVKELLRFVQQKTVTVSNITKITVEITPTFTTYHLTVLSNGKTVEIAIVQQQGKKEVIAVRPIGETATPVEETTLKVDYQGNQVTETNNITAIKESKEVQTTIKTIITEATYLQTYDVKFVQTTDYGKVQYIVVTFDIEDSNKKPVQSVAFFNKHDNTAKVISVKPIPVVQQGQEGEKGKKGEQAQSVQKQVYVSPKPVLETKVIPGFAVETALEKDKALKAVISNIQSSSPVLQSATTLSAEVQTISEEVVKYTVILDVKGEKSQAVYIANPVTLKVTPIVINKAPTESAPFYLTTTHSQQGTTIKSNSIQQVTKVHSEVTELLTFAADQLVLPKQPVIQNVVVNTNPQSTTYTITVNENTQTKTVTLTRDSRTKTIKLLDFNVAPVAVAYPSQAPVIKLHPKTDKEQVSSLTAAIEQSKLPGIQNVMEVVSVKKESRANTNRYYIEIISREQVKYFVTLDLAENGQISVLNAVPEKQTITPDVGVSSIQTDPNGNNITETTRTDQISSDSHAQTTIKEVIKSEKILKDYQVVNMRKVDFGTVEEIQFVFESEKQGQTAVHSVAYYKKTDKTVKVVSVQQIALKVEVSKEPKVSTPSVPAIPTVQVKFIPGFAVKTVVQTDKSLKAIISTIQNSSILSTSTTVSAEVQPISEEAVKYTLILDINGEKKQAIYILNPVTVQVTPIAVANIPADVKPVYIKQETNEDGSKVLQTNNLTYINQINPDFKDVSTFILTNTGSEIPTEGSKIEVTTQNNLKTYKITTKTNIVTKTVIVTSDTTTKTQFLVDYQENILAPVIEGQPFVTAPTSLQQKEGYLQWIRTIDDKRIKPESVINVVNVQKTTKALYTEVVIEVETKTGENIFIRTIKSLEQEQPQVISITPAPSVQVPDVPQKDETAITTSVVSGSAVETISSDTTVTKSDLVGNTVVESTNPTFISKNPVIQSSRTSIITSYSEYSHYEIKYTKTVDLGKVTQVVLTLEGPSPTDRPIQAIAFYNKTDKNTKIVQVQQITETDITPASYPVPKITASVIPAVQVPEIIKKDNGLKTVITEISKISTQFNSSTVSSVEVYTYDEKTVQYNVIMEVKGDKQQLVLLLDKDKNVATPISAVSVSSQIKTVLQTQTKIGQEDVIISNRIESVKKEFPQIAPTIEAFIKDNPSVTQDKIDSIVVSPTSEGSAVSILAKNEQQTSYVFTKYVTSESSQTIKVQTHVVPVISVLKPKPIVLVPVYPQEIESDKEITAQLIKIINTDTNKTTLQTSKITSIVKGDSSTVDVYTIRTFDANNNAISVEIVQNPVTKVLKVDVVKVNQRQRTVTETIVQEYSGKSEVLTTNVVTIKESKEFKKIIEYITKNHPTEVPITANPIIENTQKYQRANIKTISFSHDGKTIQGTYLIDQRSNTTVELSYTVTQTATITPLSLPIVTPTNVITSVQSITAATINNVAIANTLTVIQKVDFSLANLTPIFIEIKNYTNAATITLVYETPTSNSRILSFYNAVTKEAKVVDYTKVAKVIQPSMTVQSVNQIGQSTVFTTSIKTVATTEQFTTVYATAVKAVPSINNKPIKGVSTTTRQNGKDFTILVVDSGVISQVVLRTQTTTGEISLLSHSQTSIASEIITALPKPQPIKLTIDRIQQPSIKEIGTLISKQPSLYNSTIVSGSVTSTTLTETYNLVVKTKDQTRQVKVLKDLKTKETVVNNVQKVPKKPVVETITTTKQNAYGQIEVVTNSFTEITTTEEIVTIIRRIKVKKPKFIAAKPISSKTVTYGDIVQSTLVFSDLEEITLRPIQITSVLNTKTKNVDIVDSRSISIPNHSLVTVNNPVQTIPAPAIKIAARKNVQITKIITEVQKVTTSTTQIQTLTVEDFGNVKKYVAVAPTDAGKIELVYFFDKTTNQVKPISSRPIKVVQNPLVYTETTNQQGETVITSTSVEKIKKDVPEVTKAVELLRITFSPSVADSITSVHATGTIIKEILFVTVDKKQQQTFITVIADTKENTVKIVDVRQPSPPKPIERSEEGDLVDRGEKGMHVTPANPDQRRAIQNVIESIPAIDKTAFKNTIVTQIVAQRSAFSTTYIVKIEDKSSGVSANVTLIQNPGQNIKFLNVKTNKSEQVEIQSDVVTQTTTSAVTGQLKVLTNDRKAIEKDQNTNEITKNLIKAHPELTVYRTVATQTITYKDIQEITLVMHNEGEVSVQASVIYNTTNKNVQVVDYKKLTNETEEVVANPVKTIPAPAIKIVARKSIQISQIVKQVQQATTSKTIIQTLTVEDIGNIKKYVAIAPVESGKQQLVFLYDKTTQQLKQISSQTISEKTIPLNVEQSTSQWGETTLTTNSIRYVTQKYPEALTVLESVEKYIKSPVTDNTQSVRVVEQNGRVDYTLVVKVEKSVQEITVTKVEGKYIVQNVQSAEEKLDSREVENSKPQVAQKVEKESVKGNEITKFIQSSTISSIVSGQIVQITSTDSLISTLYQVQVKDPNGKITVLDVLSQPGQDLTLTNYVQQQPKIAETVQQSVTTKTGNTITSRTVTTTTDPKLIQSAENQPYIAEVVKSLPGIQDGEPIFIKSTSYGNFQEKTIIVKEKSRITQVTTLKNTKNNEIKVIDHKTISAGQGQPIRPVTFVSVIPAPLITATATQIPEITKIISEVKTISKTEVILDFITIEDYGSVKKYLAVQTVPTGKQHYIYLQDKNSQELKLLDNYPVTKNVEFLSYQQTTNRFGEKTVTSNSIPQVTAAVPDLSSAVKYISTKYPAATPERIANVQVVEYPTFIQSTLTVQSDTNVQVNIVVKVDKATKEVTDMGMYSPNDLNPVETPKVITSPTTIPQDSPVLADVVKYIQKSKEVPVSEVKTVTRATSTTTVFGTEVITVEGVSSDSKKVEVQVNYNSSSKEIRLNNVVVLERAEPLKESVTEFSVDVLTGTKTIKTNDTTVIKSSEITSSLLKELQSRKSDLTDAEILSSTTVEYPDKVKVVTVFDSPSPTEGEVVQVTSIYDKVTASVRVINTTTTTQQKIATAQKRKVFTSSQVQNAVLSIPSVPATTNFITKEFPIYANQAPSAVIIETVGNSDIISYIFQTTSSKTQVVVMYNRTNGQSTLLQSSPVQRTVKPFFYQEKRNTHGQSVVVSNNLTEVIQRVPKSEVLKTYIQAQKEIDAKNIKNVETTIDGNFNTYTLVVDTDSGLKQYSYLVDNEKEEVKLIENKTLTGINNVVLPQQRPKISINPQSQAALSLINAVISSSTSTLTNVQSVVSVTKTEQSNIQKYEIEYVDNKNQLTKLLVTEGADNKPTVVDQRPITPKFVTQPPVVIAEVIDTATKASEVTYASNQTFSVDEHSKQVLQYTAKNIPQVKDFTLQSVRKTVKGQIEQYDLLFKSDQKAPVQVSIANDKNNQNMIVLQTKRITQPEQKSILDSSAALPQSVQVSDIEKENIKVLSKLGLVKDVKEYKEVPLTTIGQNDQFVIATEAVKASYSVLLKESVIIKVLEKKSLETDSLKVFFKAKDQIFEASIEINPITAETKLTDFIKIGTQATTSSQVNVYADLCYGYQIVEDISADSNIDFLLTYLGTKHEQLRDASLTEAQSIVLGSGRINYKLYFKKDGQTVKYIVYYEPEYKRVLEVKGTSFLIGGKFTPIPTQQQVSDPYFRKLDTYVRQNREELTSASVLHTETSDNGRTITFRTVYSASGKTYRSVAAISKDSQNVDETALNEIVQISINDGPADIGKDGEAMAVTKLDIHDLGKNLYFTEAHRCIQAKYQAELDKAQLLGASERANLFSYLFKEFYIVDDKIITVSAEYNPVTQTCSIVSEPQVIDIQEGYFPVKSDKRLNQVRNWLREKNLDLSSAVMVSSMSKPILFGSAFKLEFKDMTKFYTYVVYYATTKEMRILYEKDSSQGETASPPENSASVAKQPKLKGFVRPSITQ